jgi:cytosine/adenosine deaminase-related metal-dependent hydrolase
VASHGREPVVHRSSRERPSPSGAIVDGANKLTSTHAVVTPMVVRARWILGPDFQVVNDGAVQVESGRIVAIEHGPATRNKQTIDLGDCLLMPGLVNAHTHLELGFAAKRVPPTPDFADWLHRLLSEIREAANKSGAVERSVRTGLAESLASGVTLLGDITRQPALTRTTIADTPDRPTVVSFGEVIAFGAIRDGADAAIERAADRTNAGNDLRIGISPHAPYTVEPNVLVQCLDRAQRDALPVCIHAAETLDEVRYTLDRTGPIRQFFESIGEWDESIPALGMRPIEFLHSAGALRPGTLLAHANYVSNEDIDAITESGTSVVYCPRTHAAFGHPPHRFRDMLARGVNVCLGTDSLASNPSLSLLEEMRFLRREHADVPPATIMQMAMAAGAKALELGEVTGQLEPGRWADMIAIPLDAESAATPLSATLESDELPAAVFVRGRAMIAH